MSGDPLVSVCTITYNHQAFIAQAVESVLMQRTNFDFEMLIGEDCSTDDTRQVVEHYAQRYPLIVKPVYRQRNLGVKENFVDMLLRCQGKYIALLEGDDYWTDPDKLQKQVDFLEQHPEHVLVCNNASLVREEEDFSILHPMKNQIAPYDFGPTELMVSNPCITLTAMFRNHLLTDFPGVYFEGTGGDRRLFLLLSLHGKCRYINDVVGVYRRHSGGLSARKGNFAEVLKSGEETIRNAESWNRYLNGQYQAEENSVRHRVSLSLVGLSLRYWKLLKAIQYSRSVNLKDIQNKRIRFVIHLLKSIDRILPLPKTSA